MFDRDGALARAMDVFWARGFEGSSMNDLTAAMGIGSPSLYAAFGSKEALFREAVERYVAVDGSDIWAAAAAADTAYGAVKAFLLTTAQSFSRTDRPSGCLVTLSGLNAGDLNEVTRAELVARRAQNIPDMARLLAKGVERGEIAPTVDLDIVARFYVTVQQGMSIQARDGTTRAALEDIAWSALAAWTPLTESRQEEPS